MEEIANIWRFFKSRFVFQILAIAYLSHSIIETILIPEKNEKLQQVESQRDVRDD